MPISRLEAGKARTCRAWKKICLKSNYQSGVRPPVGIAAPGVGSALVCVNWAGGPVRGLVVTLAPGAVAPFKTAALASAGGRVAVGKDALGRVTLAFDLSEAADAVVLRP